MCKCICITHGSTHIILSYYTEATTHMLLSYYTHGSTRKLLHTYYYGRPYTRLVSNSAPTWSSGCCLTACHFHFCKSLGTSAIRVEPN